tara:strand:+ start:932 stop:1666 length:735 start_codon:yes stop_codon:yes gene_type:complete
MSEFDDNSPFYTIKYVFKYGDGTEWVVPLRLDKSTFELVIDSKVEPKEWTALEFNQCACCPLNKEEHPQCPAARGLSMFLENFSDNLSHTDSKVAVITPERTYYKETSLQNGIYGIMGLALATSGCPIFHPLKPMARFHLPFSTVEETLARVLSFYLLQKFFQNKKDGCEDKINLDELNQTYSDIDQVNKGLLERIRSVSKKDANQNALIVLDAYKMMLSGAISDNFEDLNEYLFPATNYSVNK